MVTFTKNKSVITVGGIMVVLAGLGFFVHEGIIDSICGPSKIVAYQEALIEYMDEDPESFEELVNFRKAIDEYNRGLELAQNTFLSWPHASRIWNEREFVEYPAEMRK